MRIENEVDAKHRRTVRGRETCGDPPDRLWPPAAPLRLRRAAGSGAHGPLWGNSTRIGSRSVTAKRATSSGYDAAPPRMTHAGHQCGLQAGSLENSRSLCAT